MKKKEKAAPATQEQTPAQKTRYTILTVIGSVLCVILLPVLAVNLTLIVKSFVHSDEVPSIGGRFPLIVLTDSMWPNIQSGDLIFCVTVDPADVRVGDVISFFDPDGNGTSIVTHRVVELTETEDGELAFVTKGDANNAEDMTPVPAGSLVGVYTGRIAGAGNVALFMQTTTGFVVCVVLPLLLLVGYDLLRSRMLEKGRKKDTDALMAELEALRAAQSAPPPAASDAPLPPEEESPPAGEPAAQAAEPAAPAVPQTPEELAAMMAELEELRRRQG